MLPRSPDDVFESLTLQLGGVKMLRSLNQAPLLVQPVDPSLFLWTMSTVPARTDELCDDGLLERYHSITALLQLVVVAASPEPSSVWSERFAPYMSSNVGTHLWKAVSAYERWGHRASYQVSDAIKMFKGAVRRMKAHGASIITDVSTATVSFATSSAY